MVTCILVRMHAGSQYSLMVTRGDQMGSFFKNKTKRNEVTSQQVWQDKDVICIYPPSVDLKFCSPSLALMMSVYEYKKLQNERETFLKKKREPINESFIPLIHYLQFHYRESQPQDILYHTLCNYMYIYVTCIQQDMLYQSGSIHRSDYNTSSPCMSTCPCFHLHTLIWQPLSMLRVIFIMHE